MTTSKSYDDIGAETAQTLTPKSKKSYQSVMNLQYADYLSNLILSSQRASLRRCMFNPIQKEEKKAALHERQQ